jgi:hypothetical protein
LESKLVSKSKIKMKFINKIINEKGRIFSGKKINPAIPTP